MYYKSESETDFGCRGAISVSKAVVLKHELDELRFDISVGDCSWYLRAASVEEREKWVSILESFKKETGSQQSRLRRQGSTVSLSSNTYSAHSANSTKIRHQALKEKIAECETFRDILCRQIETLQGYFDTCSTIAGALHTEEVGAVVTVDTVADLMKQHGHHAVDFKGEAITFKATTAGILATLQYCTELMGQREDQLKKRLEKEVILRKQAEATIRRLEAGPGPSASVEKPERLLSRSGPDYEEGPHSQLGEDEFYDAVETALDKLDEELEMKDQLKVFQQSVSIEDGHRLDSEIDKVSQEQLKYARIQPGEGTWELFADEGEMKMYKREEEVDGMVVDPLKALHSVSNVTARELCHYFWSPDVRLEWEHTIDAMNVLEEFKTTLIFHQVSTPRLCVLCSHFHIPSLAQVHKRVWPTAQRDAVFWSHMQQVAVTAEEAAQGVVDCWLVTNKSTDHPAAPLGQGGCLRVILTVCFLCQTVVREGGSRNNRSDLKCRYHTTLEVSKGFREI